MSEKAPASAQQSSGILPVAITLALLLAGAAVLFAGRNGILPTPGVEAVDSAEAPNVETAVLPVVPQETEALAGDVDRTGSETEAETAGTDAAQSPTVDEVRVDNSGTVVIAGRAVPGSMVDVLVDGMVVATAQAGADGAFATIGTIAESDRARRLSLRSNTQGRTLASRGDIILAPLASGTLSAARSVVGRGVQSEDTLTSRTGEAGAADRPVTEAVASSAIDQVTDAENETQTRTAAVAPQADRAHDDGPEPDPNAAATRQPGSDVTSGDTDTAATRAGLDLPAETEEDTAAPSRIAVLRSDEDGVSLLDPAAEPSETVVLDTIGYSDTGVVQLSGRASTRAAEVRVYLDNTAVAQLRVGQGGAWRGEVLDVDSGVYTLRIDALSEDGDVTSRIETPFQREGPAVLAEADTSTEKGVITAVTVQTGDTLWAIARERYGEGVLFVQVFEANRQAIRDPDLIYPGQVFDLPAE